MSIDTVLFARLKLIPQLALAGGRYAVYPDVFPQPPAAPVWPALRYTLAGGTIYPDLAGAGDDDGDDVRVQIDAVAETSLARRELWAAVREAMQGLDPPAVLQGPPVFSYDSETKTWRAMGDFIVYGSSL
jgi:hypothetical protein